MEKIIAELAQKVQKAQNVEEVIALAKEAGIELTLEQAQKFFSQVVMDDEDLENVTGGAVITNEEYWSKIKSVKAYW